MNDFYKEYEAVRLRYRKRASFAQDDVVAEDEIMFDRLLYEQSELEDEVISKMSFEERKRILKEYIFHPSEILRFIDLWFDGVDPRKVVLKKKSKK